MRKITLVLAFIATSVAVNAQSDTKSNAIKLNPLSLAVLTGNIAYEKAVGESQSFQLGVFYSGLSAGDLKYAGFGVTPEYRFYVAGRKEALNGVYVAPFARYQNFSFKDKVSEDKATLSSIGGGAVIGWQKMWPSNFTFDLFIGPGYNAGKLKAEDSSEEDFELKGGLSGFGVRTGLTIGIGF